MSPWLRGRPWQRLGPSRRTASLLPWFQLTILAAEGRGLPWRGVQDHKYVEDLNTIIA